MRCQCDIGQVSLRRGSGSVMSSVAALITPSCSALVKSV